MGWLEQNLSDNLVSVPLVAIFSWINKKADTNLQVKLLLVK